MRALRPGTCAQPWYMVLGGAGEDHDCLPRPAYIRATAPLARKQALARLRLSCTQGVAMYPGTPIQTNLARGVPYSARLCPCCDVGVPDTEHHFLFDYCPALSGIRDPRRCTQQCARSIRGCGWAASTTRCST